jgi:arsenate reductase
MRIVRGIAHALFVCLHNAGRSQMSQALFERAAQGRHTAASAGTSPAERVHPQVVEVMRELGLELADRRPQPLTRELAERADVVVTMGCGDACPYIPGKRYVEWNLPDPKDRPVEAVRAKTSRTASTRSSPNWTPADVDQHGRGQPWRGYCLPQRKERGLPSAYALCAAGAAADPTARRRASSLPGLLTLGAAQRTGPSQGPVRVRLG